MAFTTPIFIPLVEGLDQSKESSLGERQLTVAENVDFAIQGQVRGRPSRAAASQFRVLDPASSTGAFLAAQDFDDTGFTPLGMMRLRDGSGERPMLGTAGRLFSLEGSEWLDRGHFACARVDRHATFTPGVRRSPPAQTFGPSRADAGGRQWYNLLTSDYSFDHEVRGSFPVQLGGLRSGNSARCGTTDALVTQSSINNKLFIVLRTAFASTVTEVELAADALDPDDDGDAPSICCDWDQTHFFVCYQTTTANQYKVLRVSTAGAVTHTYTGTLTGIHGHWVTNSTIGDSIVSVGLTNADGLTVKNLDAATLTDNATDSTYGTVGETAREVVVGHESDSRVWWAYRSLGASNDGCRIGRVHPQTGGSATLVWSYSSMGDGGTAIGIKYYVPMHQPVVFDGRVYITLGALNYPDLTSPGLGNWFTLDLSNTFSKPTMVARGEIDTAAFGADGAQNSTQPEAATLLPDGSGWTFASTEWQSFQRGAFGSLAGLNALTVVNAIRMSGPRAVQVAGSTIISGSVSHTISSGRCYETGFPAGAPFVGVNPVVGGGGIGAAGSYTISACWMYVDSDGTVHRSAPFEPVTQAVANATDHIEVYVSNPYFTERSNGDVKLEIYCTEVNPTADSFLYLQETVTPDFTYGSTMYDLGLGGAVVTDTQRLYTTEGEFTHVTPPADGGVAAVGRRVWVADSDTVYASLLLQPGEGVAWNDEGALQVDLPAGAGRVVAIEGLDDKLVIFCERGVFATQDGGPDNAGQGADLAFPIRLTDLGCAGPRSTCVTDRGVVFSSPLDSTDPQRGGPWLLDRSLSLTERKFLGTPAVEYIRGDGSWVPELAFSPERQQLYMSIPEAGFSGDTGVLVIDMRNSKWATWTHNDALHGALVTMDVVEGCLWTLGTLPAGFTGTPGEDALGDYTMRIVTSELASNGTDGLGWSRVRAITPLTAYDAASAGYDLTLIAYQDQTRLSSSGAVAMTAPVLDATWPSTRQAPEWRLPVQKCSSLKVELRATPAYARWTAIRLDVQPLAATKVPARQRS
jgi:hypothetical protein